MPTIACKYFYEVKEDNKGELYCGITLEWDYVLRTCILSMPEYVNNALNSFLHVHSAKAQHAPHPWTKPVFGQKIQLTEAEDTSGFLNDKEVNLIQRIIGKFYYYARSVDHTMLVALGELATKQTLGLPPKR